MRTGGCQCGAVRYEISSPPVELYVCHCRECQKRSSSAFGISAIFRRVDFRLTQGAVKSWARPTDTGRRLRCVFCPDCGSRLWHERESEVLPTISVKGGSLDQPVDLAGGRARLDLAQASGRRHPQRRQAFRGGA